MKFNTFKYFSPVIIIAAGFSCHSQTAQTWNRGMEIQTYHGGGMRPESHTVIINDSISTYIHWNMPKTDTFHFRLSTDELNGIMKMINETKFPSMRSGKNQYLVHDMPTTSIAFISKKYKK